MAQTPGPCSEIPWCIPGMAGSGSLVLRPWIRELVLGSDTLSSPQAGQLLEVLREAEAPGPSRAPDSSDVAATLLVSDGTHSVRCLVTWGTLDASDWEEKEFGFRGAEGRLLLLQDCGVRVQVAEGGAPAEFYLQVNRFSLLPTEQPRERVIGCNQDPDVQKKLYDCLEEHLSESISPSAGLSLSQLLDEVQEDQEHRGALVHLAESCLMLAGPYTAPPLTRWASSHHTTTGEAVYTVPSSWLHISENDQRVLSSLGPGQRTQDRELPPPDPALEDLSLTLISPSSPTSSGTPALPSHMSHEESGASISLLPALSLAASDPVQKGSFRPVPAICSAPGPLPPSSIHPSHGPRSPLLSCTPSLSPLGHVPSPRQAIVTRAQKPSLEFKELGLPPKNRQHSPRTKMITGALGSSPVGVPLQIPHHLQDPPKKHRDGSAFQYEYEPPCTSLCAQVQAVRLPPQLVAWALHLLMEPQLESQLTQV
ncbi:adrenocortical dysplasia protein homolog isoform X1 [Acinonyx jubatus]|uniref:Adrenocortical dysplasia protein homolog isoform X1 n=1 Tax=Acinonyx jubatus TaxID=32536 RepID=A0A6I9ZLE1_ACIJB|nr:adrenocortical dysplasia protein homolog isoform X1 [Acinonyx jubatus]XP_053066044.1 adrenocortical dysplasia protein homolog isoform X1 [Acinonyx jubatus]